ncbi:uncharacterized protein F5147DRAFT_773602 [Suillus discolor]|uniref:Ribonuclease H1 N-terminal domain-containing protein n=1 Tax=Suillus discolor TaxID=1912936 RepID=A0A9P7JU37_9AGAM|nr:uncharacterized protein F5147DRAFT_773602 [Suillus discolor]KAG2108395.1 hypothetical protein F5147DRAFT_773602 [Suillus discolor]
MSMAESPPMPAATIVDSPSDTGDSLSALLEQLNISEPTAVALTIALRGFIKDTVITTVHEVTAEATANVLTAPNQTRSIDDPAATTSIPPIDATIATAPVDTNTAGLPAAIVYTQLYGSIRYDVPAPSASGPYYWVTRGRRVSIFSTWQQTSSHIIGVSQASFSKVRSIAEGMQLIENVIDCGETEWLV